MKIIETIRELYDYKGNDNQEFAKAKFLETVAQDLPKDKYSFGQMMMIAFVAGRAFEANKEE